MGITECDCIQEQLIPRVSCSVLHKRQPGNSSRSITHSLVENVLQKISAWIWTRGLLQHTSWDSTCDTQQLFVSGYGKHKPLLGQTLVNDNSLHSIPNRQSEARILWLAWLFSLRIPSGTFGSSKDLGLDSRGPKCTRAVDVGAKGLWSRWNGAAIVSSVNYNGYALGLENLTETSTIILTNRLQERSLQSHWYWFTLRDIPEFQKQPPVTFMDKNIRSLNIAIDIDPENL